MKKKISIASKGYKDIRRCNPETDRGLTQEQVQQRVEAGAVNMQKKGLTPSLSRIFAKNIFTLFNLINIILAIAIVLVGHLENILFLGIALSNTVMGIIQEIRAKRALDKLSVLVLAKATVIRDGESVTIPHDQIVLDDIIYLTSGNQVCADAEVLESDKLDVDESLLTGESDRIRKNAGDKVLSGSYITSGKAYIRVTAIGDESYANSLTSEAKKSKKKTPRLIKTLNNIIAVLTIILIPLGTALFCANYFIRGESIQTSVLGASASMLGMIPAGLILLTGVTMTVGALKLARKKALVQALPSIETLARSNVLCLDKTGTITDGSLAFEQLEVTGDIPQHELELAISELMGALNDENATALALTEAFGKSGNWAITASVPFSSDRKWSGASFRQKGSFVLGSPNIIFPKTEADFIKRANSLAEEGLRVLCLAFSDKELTSEGLPEGLTCAALIILSDHVRENAAETFRYFADEKVIIKVISGDNPRTVSAIATKAGLEGADKALDMNTLDDKADYAALVEEYTVFGHTTPQQKKELIKGLKKNGHTACMTGDGVNDILAMREADCSLAMAEGSDAARSACDFVLMSEDFSVMVDVLKEGRRVINNIERVAAIFLLKTIYFLLLTIIYIFLPFPYPIAPLQMMPINELTVGIPSFFLALQANYALPGDKLVSNILEHTIPAAVTVVFNTLYLQLAAVLFDIPQEEFSTMVVFLLGIVGFYLLFRLARPYTKNIKIMLACLVSVFAAVFLFAGKFFMLTSLINRNIFFYLPLVYFSYYIHSFLGKICRKAMDAYYILKKSGWSLR